MGKKKRHKQKKGPVPSLFVLSRRSARLNSSSRHVKVEENKDSIQNAIYSLMLDYTKSIYGEGWRKADDILLAYKKTEDPENINLSELIRILKSDNRFVCGYQGCTVFRLSNSHKVKSVFDSSGFISHVSIAHNRIKDESFAFQDEYRQLIRAAIPKEPVLDVALGLDFGTSYTKAAFIESVNNKGLIPFGDQPMKASVVYSDNEFTRLSMFEEKDLKKQIRYFKATISPQDEYRILQDKSTRSPHDSSYICAIFFVANIIRFIKLKLSVYLHAQAELQINMGMPTLHDNEVARIYRKVLHAARYIAEMDCDIITVDVDILRRWVSEAERTFDEEEYIPGHGLDSTYPELFAEALYLLERKSYGPGFYTIIDIGGGTADFMFMEKHSLNDRQSNYTCYWASVEPLGNEIRKAMLDKKKYIDAFSSVYREMMVKGKKDIKEFGSNLENVQTMLFGGGKLAEDHYYEKLIAAHRLDPMQYGFTTTIVEFSCDDISFIQSNRLAADQRNPSPFRFVTAYRLATKVGDGNSRLQMLHVQPSAVKEQGTKDTILEEHKIKAGYEDIN